MSQLVIQTSSSISDVCFIPTITSSVDENQPKSSIFIVIINALNIIAGTSFIGLPYAMKQSGLVVSLIILIILSYLTDLTH